MALFDDANCMHCLRFRCPFQNGRRIFIRRSSDVSSPPSLLQLAFLKHDWLSEKYAWGLRRAILAPPLSEKWLGNLAKDFAVGERHGISVATINPTCDECRLQMEEKRERVIHKHYKCPYLPGNYAMINRYAAPRTKDETWRQFRGQPWWHFGKELTKRRVDFHSEHAGILATEGETYLDSLQTVYDMQNLEVSHSMFFL